VRWARNRGDARASGGPGRGAGGGPPTRRRLPRPRSPPTRGDDVVIRVAVADDQALVRLGLRVLLETEEDMELVGEAVDGRSAVELVRRDRPDVVLMDVRMPVMDGIEALREIAADPRLADARVVMLTAFELDEDGVDALRPA